MHINTNSFVAHVIYYSNENVFITYSVTSIQYIHFPKKSIKIKKNLLLPIVAIPAPIIIKTTPNIRARNACHKQLVVIFPLTTCTFHVAPNLNREKLIIFFYSKNNLFLILQTWFLIYSESKFFATENILFRQRKLSLEILAN